MDEYMNKHMGKDIYILASGKTIDYIDTSFFEGKIVIGVNQVYKKFVPTYLVRKERALLLDVLKACPQTIHFISRGNCGGNKILNTDTLRDVEDKNIVIYDHDNNVGSVVFPSGKDKLVVSRSTITTAIHLAAYMGAKNIMVVGHDCGLLDGECNFKGYHSNETYKIAHKGGEKRYKTWITGIEQDTIALRKILRTKYGCNIYSINPFINIGLEGHVYTTGEPNKGKPKPKPKPKPNKASKNRKK